MITVWKYPLEKLLTMNSQTIEIPEDHTLLDVQLQDGVITIWAMVDTTSKLKYITIRIVGTGQNIEFNTYQNEYIGTVQLSNGTVWHIFKQK